MNRKPKGRLIIIGGHESKEGDCTILETIVEQARDKQGSVLIMTVATQLPEEVAEEYRAVFSKMGISRVDVLDIRTRDDGFSEENVKKIEDAAVIFFTGGDQVRLTSQLGGSLVCRTMWERFAAGATVAGTSAGAAAMADTMLTSGQSDSSMSIGSVEMAPGLGFLDDTVIDSHFAERGRIGRLLGAVAKNPKYIGLGIDEDTAIVIGGSGSFEVIGSGAVYVVDGMHITYTSLAERRARGILSMSDVTLHVLGEGDGFDLQGRRPLFAEVAKQEA